MPFKDEWKDLEDAVSGIPNSGSDISVGSINMIAHQVIANESNIANVGKTVDTANAELESILAGGVD